MLKPEKSVNKPFSESDVVMSAEFSDFLGGKAAIFDVFYAYFSDRVNVKQIEEP